MNDFICEVRNYVYKSFMDKDDLYLFYHNWNHVFYVFTELKKACTECSFSLIDSEKILIAALFHDIGYLSCYHNHEDKSILLTKEYLLKKGFSEKYIKDICVMINYTKYGELPNFNTPEYFFVLKDVDLSYGIVEYHKRQAEIRLELERMSNKKFDNLQWYEMQLEFLKNLKFFSRFGRNKYENIRCKVFESLKMVR
jgi:predicted metal-dependent HD superfamily phosphohydrolase